MRDQGLDARSIGDILREKSGAPELGGFAAPVLANWDAALGPKCGLPIHEICQDLYSLTNGWPKRITNILFVPGENFTPRYLETPTQLFAWFDALCHVDWGRQSDMITQERFHAHLQETAERYDTIESYPHWPQLPDAYYLHPPLPETDGTYLHEFLDFFSPLTPVDRDLLQAFVLGLFWGGPPGARPAWLFTAPEDDHEGGRGVGKSKCIEMCAELVGGMLEVSPAEDIVAIKKRLLSPAARTLRVARIDNIKTYRFSWADLEGLITSPVISGHRLYHGEARRNNTLTWALTLNGASLSRDMAKRVIVIKLRRPAYRPGWESDVRGFIREYRWHITRDIISLLHQPAGTLNAHYDAGPQGERYTRWAAFEGEVLSRVSDPAACRRLILERQAEVDDETNEADLVVAHLRNVLIGRRHNPDGPGTKCLTLGSRQRAAVLLLPKRLAVMFVSPPPLPAPAEYSRRSGSWPALPAPATLSRGAGLRRRRICQRARQRQRPPLQPLEQVRQTLHVIAA